ncbi:phage minor capsid protein [Sporosarcina sp. FSL K6-1522]|uniref:phage minor capsid protein n=1 Tax=Sporosarcina sp. FSL K6-1522 TaxID=2921554 RepID=UPI00315A9AA2
MNEEQLLTYLRDIITGISDAVAESDLSEEQQVEALVRDIKDLLDQFSFEVEKVIPEAILLTYFGGVDEATKALKSAGVSIRATTAVTPTKEIAKSFQSKIHMDAVKVLLDDTLLDFRAAIRTAEMSATSNITKTLENVKGDLAKGVIVGDPRKVIQAQVAKSFAKDGLTAFVTSDGKKLPLDFYAMTVTRYKTREAANAGATNRYIENGQDLVQVTGNSDTCPVCARHRGMVISLNGLTPGYPVVGEDDVRIGPYHPNCRCGVMPFVLRFKTEEELAEAHKRNESYKPWDDPRTPAQKRAYEREQTARRKANDEKKQYARWKMALGDDAPKTLGAFRRMKRQGTTKFQEMQAEYKRIMRDDVK